MEYAESWKAERMPLKVYIYPCAEEGSFGLKYIEAFKSACQCWSETTENLIRFQFVDGPENADVDVKWISEKPPSWDHAVGITEFTRDGDGNGAVHASITLLTRIDGRHAGAQAMHQASLHELGHSFGLGHSGRKSDVMYKSMDMANVVVDGQPVRELVRQDPKLTSRDITTMKVVYSGKQKLDTFRAKNLDQRTLCTELTKAAVNLISTGDSGTAIVFLREVLRLDSSYKVASENLMAAYYNCGADLYNKRYYSEALPLLEKSLELGRKVGNSADLNMVQAVYRNCLEHR